MDKRSKNVGEEIAFRLVLGRSLEHRLLTLGPGRDDLSGFSLLFLHGLHEVVHVVGFWASTTG